MKANKAVAKAKTVAKVAGKLGKDFANDPKGFPSRHLTGFIGEQPANATDLGSRIGTSIANSPLAHKYNQVDNYVNPRHPRILKRLQEKTGRDYNTKVKAGEINLSTKAFADFVGISDKNWYKNNVPGFIRNARINKQLYGHPTVKGWHSSQRTGRGHGLKINKDIIEATQAKQAQKAQQKAEEKALDKQYKQDQAIYNNNKKNMSVTIGTGSQNKSNTGPNTSDKDWLKGAYKEAFGEKREANFDAKGGAQYWLDQMSSNPTSHSRDEVLRMLKGSDEGKKFAASGVTMPGGVDPNKSIHSQFGTGNTWLEHWAPGGKLAPTNIDDTFKDVNSSISQINPGTTYKNFDDDTFIKPIITDPNPPCPNPPGPNPPGPGGDAGWWTKFADADAFKKFLQGDQKSDGMGDFMKFMMLMNVMRPGGQGGYGGGGSQYGYGGLNPGGVQSAYDPMASLQGMGDWFKKNFGSGGSTTATVNTD